MKITLRVFAMLREQLGRDRLELDLPAGSTAGDVIPAAFHRLAESGHEAIRDSILFAINQCYAHADTPLHNGDEVALIPPVAGG